MDNEIVRGRDNILRLVKRKSWTTIKTWEKQGIFPLKHDFRGRVFVIASEVRRCMYFIKNAPEQDD